MCVLEYHSLSWERDRTRTLKLWRLAWDCLIQSVTRTEASCRHRPQLCSRASAQSSNDLVLAISSFVNFRISRGSVAIFHLLGLWAEQAPSLLIHLYIGSLNSMATARLYTRTQVCLSVIKHVHNRCVGRYPFDWGGLYAPKVAQSLDTRV